MTFDATAPAAADAPATERGAACGFGYFWTTVEVAIVRQHYPVGGCNACQPLLPNRKRSAIHAKAQQMGLKAPAGLTKGKRFARLHRTSDALDAQIRAVYAEQTQRGAVKAWAERNGLPAWWVQKRATVLGVARSSRTRVDCWTRPELDLLEEFAACDLRVIAKKLRDAGFSRTPVAIGVQLKRRKLDRHDPDVWTAPDLAGLLGVNPATVADWITRRGLKAEKHARGQFGVWVLNRRQVKAWVAANPRYIDLRKVDQVWFMDLAFGAAANAAATRSAA